MIPANRSSIARAGYRTYIPAPEEPMNDTIAVVAALLRRTAEAHHRAFASTDGADPDWPSWYAEHLTGRLGGIGIDLSPAMLTRILVEADRDHPDAGAGWPEVYAADIVAGAR
jgi:NAD(P)H-hydrate epimerase